MNFIIFMVVVVIIFLMVNFLSLIAEAEFINEVAFARVQIISYYEKGDDGIVVCTTNGGYVAHLIDPNQKFRTQCVLNGGKYILIRFKLDIDWCLFCRIRLYIVGVEA